MSIKKLRMIMIFDVAEFWKCQREEPMQLKKYGAQKALRPGRRGSGHSWVFWAFYD
jgi:hypothetical protein